MNITVNQNRQLYVANKGYVSNSTDAGTISKVAKTPQNELYFIFQGAKGPLKSDLIQLKNLDTIKKVSATDMIIPLKQVKVALDSNVNGGDPISGEDYELKIHLPGFYTDTAIEDYYKYGIVHATAAMVADKKEFYKAMVKSLNANFSREVDATATSNPYLEFSAGTAGSEDGIYITAKEPVWTLGTEQQRMIDFEALPQTVYTGGDDLVWGVVTPVANTGTVGTDAIGNGKKIADLEYFCMGERGDQYRNMGWPNVIETEYLVDPTKQYDVLELHFAFTDTGVNSYRSEKDITIVAPYDPTGDNAAAKHAKMNLVISAINSAYGSTLIAAWS